MNLQTEWNLLMIPSFSFWLFAISCVFFVLHLCVRRLKFVRRVNSVPGPPAPWPLIGNALDILRDPDDLFTFLVDFVGMWRSREPILRFWAGPSPIFLVYTAHAAEVLLGSSKLIDKCREYDFLKPWLNTGLLTSTGDKWRLRRKLLTPTFHFKILEDFVEVFNEQSWILVDKFRRASEQNPSGFNIFPYVTRCTLDIICDTAMGRHVDAQNDAHSSYVQAVYRISRIVQTRQIRPWLQSDFAFGLTSLGKEQQRCLEILHSFTKKVIRERRAEHQESDSSELMNNNYIVVDDNVNDTKAKKRLAFLDLLISASGDGILLSDEDIREEVDTFMFEGHDTTAAAISWSLHLIGSHPEVQTKVHEELNRVFGGSNRPATIKDLGELRYLECCIKEALRLYPSVPLLGRTINEDTEIHGYKLPSGTTVALVSYMLHRDPIHFPNPDDFIPERFYPENSRGRHPYCYVPFSAGPRNCIGQKFALMEEKVVLSTVLRNFSLESLDKREDMVLLGELVLRPRDGLNVRFIPKTIVDYFLPTKDLHEP